MTDSAAEKTGRAAKGEGESQRLGQLRLLVALDALLVEGSVGGAARQMGLSIAAMSRLLGQIREKFGDPILMRSGRTMVATPKAEALRARLRHLANEADALLTPGADIVAEPARPDGWNRGASLPPPPLGIRRAVELLNHPTPEQLAAQLANIRDENDPARRLAKYIAVVGRKIGQTRPLEAHEAEDAFTTIFAGEADPMQIGALLRLIHYRGETAPELAGMVRAARRFYASPAPAVGLDWPAYLSPNSFRPPWFMLAAMLVARAGHPIVLHGNRGAGDTAGKLELAAEALGIPLALSHAQALEALRARGICFMPLAGFAPQAQALLALYPLFESRSPVNSLVHLINPMNLGASFLGVTQPAYRELHRDAGALLGVKHLSVVSTSRDVAELVPHRAHAVHRLIGGAPHDLFLPTLSKDGGGKHASLTSFEHWIGVWNGTAADRRAENTVIATAALAMMTVCAAGNDAYERFHGQAEALWRARQRKG